MYTFSLADQVCVPILIGGEKLFTHSHWQSIFMYTFSLAEQIYEHMRGKKTLETVVNRHNFVREQIQGDVYLLPCCL